MQGVGLDVKVTAAVWRSGKTDSLSLSLSLLTLQHETARLKIPLYPLHYLSFKKIIALSFFLFLLFFFFLTITPVCPLCEVNPSLPFHTHGLEQVSGQVAGGSGSGPFQENNIASTSTDNPADNRSGNAARMKRETTPTFPDTPSLRTLSLSKVSLCLCLLMIALTLERPTVQMHTHIRFTVTRLLACLLNSL